MKVAVSQVNEFEKKLEISVPWEAIKEEYTDLMKRYTNVPIKGFRAGKAPMGLVESTFKNEIKNDLVSVCSKRFCRKAMQDNELEAASPLEIMDMVVDKDKFLSFNAFFIQMPAFDLPDYRHLQLQETKEEARLDEISLKLLEKTTVEFHSSLVELELGYSDIEGDESSEEDILAAKDRVKLMLILKKIATQDNVEIDDKHIEERMKEIAGENEVTPDELKTYLLSNGGFSRFTDSLLAEQVLLYIIDIQE